jgi:ABC-type nitrate/sulfonate/bicarbonate transport system substrate-binding protein
MGHHQTQILKSGSGLIGVCSCKQRKMSPVSTRQEAEDWCRNHLAEAARAAAALQKPLTPAAYLEYLQECADDTERSPEERAQWQQLANEQERRIRLAVQPKMKGVPVSPNAKYDTGVETEPMF